MGRLPMTIAPHETSMLKALVYIPETCENEAVQHIRLYSDRSTPVMLTIRAKVWPRTSVDQEPDRSIAQ
jgi:hypothetical protein